MYMYNTDAAFVLYSLKKKQKISGQTIHAYIVCASTNFCDLKKQCKPQI